MSCANVLEIVTDI